MAIKQLQNNYTTPEQSMRLLELGVPADSADGFYSRESYRGGQWERPRLFESQRDKVNFKSVYEGGVLMYLPLFTVGQLKQIYKIVGENAGQYISCNSDVSMIEGLVQLFEENVFLLDFSKLED